MKKEIKKLHNEEQFKVTLGNIRLGRKNYRAYVLFGLKKVDDEDKGWIDMFQGLRSEQSVDFIKKMMTTMGMPTDVDALLEQVPNEDGSIVLNDLEGLDETTFMVVVGQDDWMVKNNRPAEAKRVFPLKAKAKKVVELDTDDVEF